LRVQVFGLIPRERRDAAAARRAGLLGKTCGHEILQCRLNGSSPLASPDRRSWHYSARSGPRAGFAILPIRAVLYTLSDDTAWFIAVQLLDGVGAGVFGALTPLLLADLMRGTGRDNLAQGAVGTVQGIGASSSGLVAGIIVDHLGYNAAFLTAGGVASVALTLLVIAMPETAPRRQTANRNGRSAEWDGLSLPASAEPYVESGSINTGMPR
jgi:MFS family permease